MIFTDEECLFADLISLILPSENHYENPYN